MRAGILLVSSLAALSLGFTVAAQERRYEVTINPANSHPDAVQKIRVSKAVIGSSQIVIWGGASIEPDCTEHPGYTLSIVKPPAHGEVKVVEEGIYLAFPPSNPRSACNSRKVPGRKVYYTANAGFSGHDRVVLEGASDNGTMRDVTIDVEVRKAAG